MGGGWGSAQQSSSQGPITAVSDPADREVVKTLCKRWGKQAVEARIKGNGMNTPLMTAIKYGHVDVALDLINATWDTVEEVGGEDEDGVEGRRRDTG